LSWGLIFPGGGAGSRHGIDFTTICSEQALLLAWTKFSRGKKKRDDVADFSKNLNLNISQLSYSLKSGTYTHATYQTFVVCDPKRREIHKATVRDRLVHQALVSAIEPMFEKRFIYDSYSCRKGKGAHKGVDRLKLFLRQASLNDASKAYVLKCDVRKFFASIDHIVLLELVGKRISDPQTFLLIKNIIESLNAETRVGIPLGNVTSQLFANIYLHELDWFIKQTLGLKHYLRYCDDFVIVSTDKYYLEALVPVLGNFLRTNLILELHPQKVMIRSWRNGVDFLGFVLRPKVTTIRKVTSKRMLKRVGESNLSSYLGICSHGDEFNLGELLKLVAWVG
jgi:RNA-directed DNA polymerase